MWLLTGPFDSGVGDVTTTRTKLLKTGRKISLGRKEKHLIVNNKKISRDHCEFTVGPCTLEDAENPSFVPALEIYNAKEKAMSIDRDGHAVIVNPSSSCELRSGDKIHIVVGVSLEVNWRRIACFLPPARSLPSVSREGCASMGISLITSPSALATHHLTPKYELTVQLATSLLSATQLVKVEWLQEFIRQGTTVDDSHPFKLTPLEQTFSPPLESKYRPVFSPSLATPLKSFKFWEPNEGRLHLFKGYRFVLPSDDEGRVDADTRELIVRGDGEYECFLLTSGEAKWRQLLGKAKRRVDEASLKVVIIAREHVTRATVGEDKWREMTADAQSLSLPVVNLHALMNAVINTDASLISEGSSGQGAFTGSESPLPDFVPNTHPNEPSLPPAPEKDGVQRRSPSPSHTLLSLPAPEKDDVQRRSSSSSPMVLGLAIPPPPSKNLIRRNRPPSTTSRAKEPVEHNAKEGTQAEDLGYTLPPLPEMKRSSKLRRRTPVPVSSAEEPIAVDEGQEPPLKKFKALFDASDPDKMVVDSHDFHAAYDGTIRDSVGITQGGESFTQSDSRLPHSQTVAPLRTLDAVVEEQEEESGHSQIQPPAPHSRQKTPLPRETQRSHVDGTQDSGTSRKSPSKQAKPKTAQNHLMDTDPAFLTAIASKKGKKTAGDDFDREFNNLRIAKPDIRREGEEQPWEILGDFDPEARNLRGNFMVVVDLDVLPRSRVPPMRTYDGRPNFKKFKKAPTPSSRAPIELVARAEHDYGVGLGYWKENDPSNSQGTLASSQTLGTQRRRALTVLESDGADSDVPVAKLTEKAARKAPRSKGTSAARKLFLNSDDENSEPDAGLQENVGKSQAGKIDSLPTRRSKRRHIIVDDDSDDGVAFKGFGKKRRT